VNDGEKNGSEARAAFIFPAKPVVLKVRRRRHGSRAVTNPHMLILSETITTILVIPVSYNIGMGCELIRSITRDDQKKCQFGEATQHSFRDDDRCGSDLFPDLSGEKGTLRGGSACRNRVAFPQ